MSLNITTKAKALKREHELVDEISTLQGGVASQKTRLGAEITALQAEIANERELRAFAEKSSAETKQILQQERLETGKQLAEANVKQGRLQHDLETLTKQIAGSSSELNDFREECERSKEANAHLQVALEISQNKIVDCENETLSAKNQYESSCRELNRIRDEVIELKSTMESALQELEAERVLTARITRDLSEKEREIENEQAESGALRLRLRLQDNLKKGQNQGEVGERLAVSLDSVASPQFSEDLGPVSLPPSHLI